MKIKTQQGEATGIKLPYIVTLEMGSTDRYYQLEETIQADDPQKLKIDYFVHFKFLPGMGFYGFGLIHMIGGLSRTATTALRQLLDAGTLSNLPAGFKQRGITSKRRSAGNSTWRIQRCRCTWRKYKRCIYAFTI